MQIARRLSITLSKRGLTDSQCRRWKSFASATVLSDSTAVKTKPKRVSKDERKAMVQAFVNKYRAMNGGKFPRTKEAMKEVGGSYYTIKKIVQELQYNSKMQVEHKDSLAKEASAGEAATRKDDLLIKVEETLIRATVVEHGECKDGQLMNETLLDKELTQNRKPSPEVEEILSDWRTAAPVLEPELNTSSHSEEPENNIKQEVSPMENFKYDDLKQMDEQKHTRELEKPTRELSNEHKADTQAENKSSMWKNLKSLADGFLSLWRK